MITETAFLKFSLHILTVVFSGINSAIAIFASPEKSCTFTCSLSSVMRPRALHVAPRYFLRGRVFSSTMFIFIDCSETITAANRFSRHNVFTKTYQAICLVRVTIEAADRACTTIHNTTKSGVSFSSVPTKQTCQVTV